MWYIYIYIEFKSYKFKFLGKSVFQYGIRACFDGSFDSNSVSIYHSKSEYEAVGEEKS